MKIENSEYLLKMIETIIEFEKKVENVKRITDDKKIIKNAIEFYAMKADDIISNGTKIVLDSNTNSTEFERLVEFVDDILERYNEIYYRY